MCKILILLYLSHPSKCNNYYVTVNKLITGTMEKYDMKIDQRQFSFIILTLFLYLIDILAAFSVIMIKILPPQYPMLILYMKNTDFMCVFFSYKIANIQNKQ